MRLLPTVLAAGLFSLAASAHATPAAPVACTPGDLSMGASFTACAGYSSGNLIGGSPAKLAEAAAALPVPVPEPAALLLAGLAGIAALRRPRGAAHRPCAEPPHRAAPSTASSVRPTRPQRRASAQSGRPASSAWRAAAAQS
jgi:hypothetical protein